MENNPNSSPSVMRKRLSKYNAPPSQLQTIFTYLKENTATASMVSYDTGIPRKSICRYKRDLEKAGLLREIEKDICEVTGHKAWYITTDQRRKLIYP
jgi:predicted transcriptional regulator